MQVPITYTFNAKVWRYSGPNGWYFVSLPKDLSEEIRTNLGWQEEGWGRMKAKAQIGQTQWDTAIWYDSKAGTYLLPLKANVRAKEKVDEDQSIEVAVYL